MTSQFYLAFFLGVCPVLCSGNGDYEDGQCRCYPGNANIYGPFYDVGWRRTFFESLDCNLREPFLGLRKYPTNTVVYHGIQSVKRIIILDGLPFLIPNVFTSFFSRLERSGVSAQARRVWSCGLQRPWKMRQRQLRLRTGIHWTGLRTKYVWPLNLRRFDFSTLF